MTIAWLLIAAACAASVAGDEGFVPLFDGATLEQWDGAAGFWRVEDGAITGETTAERTLAHHSYLIWRGGELEDFELRLAFRLLSGNSGVQYRSRDLGDHEVAGYQCNIETKKPGCTAVLEEMKAGRGGRLIHKLNGHVAIDVTDRQEGKAARRGILALQLHTGRPMKVQFKDIRLKQLDPETDGRLLP